MYGLWQPVKVKNNWQEMDRWVPVIHIAVISDDLSLVMWIDFSVN